MRLNYEVAEKSGGSERSGQITITRIAIFVHGLYESRSYRIIKRRKLQSKTLKEKERKTYDGKLQVTKHSCKRHGLEFTIKEPGYNRHEEIV